MKVDPRALVEAAPKIALELTRSPSLFPVMLLANV